MRISGRVANLALVALMTTTLLGCSDEQTERILNKETYEFSGVFDNLYNQDRLEFRDAYVTIIKTKGENFTKPFEVKDNFLTIQMRNSSKEKREDIVMRIHGNNELLTCSVCAKYQLASTWQKRQFEPDSASSK
ncbi:hypothetical protein [Vibrio sinaloensis]|uniref:hypothetical protein n=1 Tax=Photobacterium sp. (strain ATCC 43367) TaxID=379097 RepID=UPI002050D179|nr:hypothetical protein [Vibrio sinaloensis]UPQ89326.1 hypothetical protein MTO69_16295 [Vibrio sinaloensis]